MEQSAEIIADSIGPNGKRITTLRIMHNRFIHAELLRHRMFSFSVASSRAIPYGKQRAQVFCDPVIPIAYQATHKGMQGSALLTDGWPEFCEKIWLGLRSDAVRAADELDRLYQKDDGEWVGLTKQLLNRMIEPWVSTRCIITATEWDGFFRLRHPWRNVCDPMDGETFQEWEDEPNLEFPAEIHIQELAIKMKTAIDASTPAKLEAGDWHLPFIGDEDAETVEGMGIKEMENDENIWLDERIEDYAADLMIRLSAARNAFTSYDRNEGKSPESELKTAESLIKMHHWSPFEHQAMATSLEEHKKQSSMGSTYGPIPDGMEIRIDGKRNASYWSRNFKGWVQARATLD